MGEAAVDGRLVGGAPQPGRDRLVANPAGQTGAAIELAVFGIDRLGVIVGAGVGAWRMPGDQVVDFQPILDGADAAFERAVFLRRFFSSLRLPHL